MEDLISASQASKLVGMSDQAITGWARKGRLPYTPTPLGRLYRAEDVKRAYQEQVVNPHHKSATAKQRTS